MYVVDLEWSLYYYGMLSYERFGQFCDKTEREYLTAPTDDLITFWRLKVKGQGRGEGMHIDVWASKYIFYLAYSLWCHV